MHYQREFWGPRSGKDYRCRDCGRSRQEAKEIDVHHIDPDGGDHPDNLVGLCRRCHLEARHRRDDSPGQSPFEPDAPSTGPRQPRSLGPVQP